MTKIIRLTFFIFFIVNIPDLQAQSSGKRLLKKAYKQNSIEILNQFFWNWHITNQPYTQAELAILNDTIKEAYNIFQTIYKNTLKNNIDEFEIETSDYSKAKYLIIQNKLIVSITDSIIYYSENKIDSLAYLDAYNEFNRDSIKTNAFFREIPIKKNCLFYEKYSDYSAGYYHYKLKTDTINNFKPIIELNEQITLYYNQKAINDLESFLYSNPIIYRQSDKEEINKRKSFISKLLKIHYAHWDCDGFYQLDSYPKVKQIIFDKHLRIAIVESSVQNEYSKIILEKTNGKWVVVNISKHYIHKDF